MDLLSANPRHHTLLLERLTEVVVLVSLFTAGLKLSPGLDDRRWVLPLRLALVSMVITVGAIAAVAYLVLHWPVGACVLLGAILAPTDPVLASDVQVQRPGDRDRLRFALTGEGGLNDGTAFPFVLLGLGLLGLRDIGEHGLRWLAVDLAWGTAGGLGIGFLVGTLLARCVRRLRTWRRDAVAFDEFLLLGVIGLSYGAAQLAHTLGFLAVFAAGLALRRADDIHAGSSQPAEKPPLTPSMLSVNEQLERIVEVAIVLLVGAMISTGYWSRAGLVVAALLIFVIRPMSVWLGVSGGTERAPRRLLAWFGIRGIGSVYYAVYVAGHDIRHGAAVDLLSCVLTVVAASILVHGISATPLMELYRRRRGAARGAGGAMSDK
jgi:NhaP-type Na+/H+ or K+/H+ antiporter